MSRSLPIDVDSPGSFGHGFFLPVSWALHAEFNVEVLRRRRAARADWSAEEEIRCLAGNAAAGSFRNFTAEAQ